MVNIILSSVGCVLLVTCFLNIFLLIQYSRTEKSIYAYIVYADYAFIVVSVILVYNYYHDDIRRQYLIPKTKISS